MSPSRDPVIAFASFPDLSEQCLAVQRELWRSDVPSRPTWLVDHIREAPASGQPWLDAAAFVPRRSPRGLWHFATAPYLFVTHSMFHRIQRRRFQPTVNLWHGMPVKGIGGYLGRGDYHQWGRNVTHIATSEFYREVMARVFGVDPDEILVSGNPRNDIMLSPEVDVRAALGLPAGRRLVLHLPTFRQSRRGSGRLDGDPQAEAVGSDAAQVEVLGNALERHDAVLLSKPHPASTAADLRDMPAMERVRVIDDEWLVAQGIGLYQLLSIVDVLVTDLSSVYLDFLLLDRPIVFYFRDLHEYLQSRKLVVDSFDEFAPGPLVQDPADLPAVLDALLGGADDHAADRARLRDLCHDVQDATSARRVLAALGLVDANAPAPTQPEAGP